VNFHRGIFLLHDAANPDNYSERINGVCDIFFKRTKSRFFLTTIARKTGTSTDIRKGSAQRTRMAQSRFAWRWFSFSLFMLCILCRDLVSKQARIRRFAVQKRHFCLFTNYIQRNFVVHPLKGFAFQINSLLLYFAYKKIQIAPFPNIKAIAHYKMECSGYSAQ